jgi:hypothetical protein
VRLGKIDGGQMNYYYMLPVDGVDVYYQDNVATHYRELTVKLEKILFFKKLAAV